MSDVYSSVPDGFRQIPGFPRYCISENGVILSACKRSKTVPWSDARKIIPTIGAKGYLAVSLWKVGDRPRRIRVHTLVLMAFVGPRPDGLECRHLDGNPANNHISNLRWGTHRENQLDRRLHGTSNQGEKCNNAKLKVVDVLQIRRRAASGELHRVIAEDFHITRFNISNIVRRYTWKHV